MLALKMISSVMGAMRMPNRMIREMRGMDLVCMNNLINSCSLRSMVKLKRVHIWVKAIQRRFMSHTRGMAVKKARMPCWMDFWLEVVLEFRGKSNSVG